MLGREKGIGRTLSEQSAGTSQQQVCRKHAQQRLLGPHSAHLLLSRQGRAPYARHRPLNIGIS